MCFIVPLSLILKVGFSVFSDIRTPFHTYKLISARFHDVSEETLWQDCGMRGMIPYGVWYGSVILYLFVKAVQLQLMFFLADYGMVNRMEEQKYSRKFLKEGIQRLTNEVIGYQTLSSRFLPSAHV